MTREFRDRIKRIRDDRPDEWAASRAALSASSSATMLTRLAGAVRAAGLPDALRHDLLQALKEGKADRVQDLSGQALSALTGLPPSKAVRALCVHFGLVAPSQSVATPDDGWDAERLVSFVQTHANPYDLLSHVAQPSLLDLGAGDLSFLAELADRYVARRAEGATPLILHGIDRLKPGSQLGARLQADPAAMNRLKGHPPTALQFRFWGDQDMFELHGHSRQALPAYSIVTCHAPASPTFAYEPTRLSPMVIEAHLRQSKGEFRKVREGREEALEVTQGGKALLFPPWKFEIRGPVALLELLAQRGRIAVLSAVDHEVFWEMLAQLVEDPRYRPRDVVFTAESVREAFGEIFTRLSSLGPGERLALSDLTSLRAKLPSVLTGENSPQPFFSFRHVEIRRGALFEGLPAGLTARLFKDMSAEATPWMLVLVPERKAKETIGGL